ncbi:uncharacterized protein LOC111341260 [Stylophora pistillata]|uniref:uncharacterized protein LOC111341260 n=1 Tax=Stylophora pistillata TaxID=50429 RepID=UPI000C042E90|nr:uncharacterized protein LOC111341260 [Stylophora pistillata]
MILCFQGSVHISDTLGCASFALLTSSVIYYSSMESIPGAVRSWYSKIKNGYRYQTGQGNGHPVGHFQTVVWKGVTKLSCGLNIKPGDGTFVTAHYAPAFHATRHYSEHARENVMPRRQPESSCEIESDERVKCSDSLVAPFATPKMCLDAGCCYDDMFMNEPNVNFYNRNGKTWCFQRKQA